MKIDEAIKQVNYIRSLGVEVFHDEELTALDMAIEALEKQIPVQAIREETANNFMCPTCKKVYEDWYEFNVCQNCGQFFDWPEQEV